MAFWDKITTCPCCLPQPSSTFVASPTTVDFPRETCRYTRLYCVLEDTSTICTPQSPNIFLLLQWQLIGGGKCQSDKTNESPSPGTSPGSSYHHLQRRFLLALWTGVRRLEEGLLPSMKPRSHYKEKSKANLTKWVHANGTLFPYVDRTGNI